MARVKLEINKEEFQKIVTELEAKQTFENPSLLWKAVEATEWAKVMQPRPLTAAVAYARSKELGIVYKAQPGKKGRVGGFPGGNTGVRVPRSKKMKAFAASFAKMRKNLEHLKAGEDINAGSFQRFIALIDKAEQGSAKACIKLKCIDCSGYQPGEVKACPVIDCSLYPIRPFQGKLEVTE